MPVGKDILWRMYLVYILLIIFSLSILGKVIYIQFYEGDKWRSEASRMTTRMRVVKAVRGNIYARDGSLLAVSMPIYELRFDPNTQGIDDEIWNRDIDSLCLALHTVFSRKSADQWKRTLVRARSSGERFHLIARNVRYNQLKNISKFPIFRRGRFKGGLIVLQQNKRERPFRLLAARTIGYDREGIKPVGIEGAYAGLLRGKDGAQLCQKITGGRWMPISDGNTIDPVNGSDIITTIDIALQDVAENALMTQLSLHNADHGCAVLMEVETGAVRAIANLRKGKEDGYYEYYNYAIGESTEPGSTFKLPVIMAAIEDGRVRPTDSVDTENGSTRYYDRIMRDSHHGGFGVISCQRAVEVSSNVGVSKLISRSYGNDPERLISKLYDMHLNEPLGVALTGEGKPMIKTPDQPGWSGVSLPWMSIGYEVKQTPLQILTFYNSIANNGTMVKPRFVEAAVSKGKVIRKFREEIIDESICSQKTISIARKMLEGVVERGTARNLKDAHFKIAGKTGTAQIANKSYGYGSGQEVSYQASFVGYFPADKPRYSCIVVVNAPSNDVYYGNQVAGPIFKEIAEKVYTTSIDMQDPLARREQLARTRIPVSSGGDVEDLKLIADSLDIPTVNKGIGRWAVTATGSDTIVQYARDLPVGVLPNVIGLNVKDAVYILENLGLVVKLNGIGKVSDQRPAPGSRLVRGQSVILKLDT